MNIINVRNRYRYETTWGTATSVVFELRFWYPAQSKPTAATYTLEKIKYAADVPPYFDLSKFAKDYTLKEPYKPTNFNTSVDGGHPMVNVEVITKKDAVVTNTQQFKCLYGYENNVTVTGTYLLRPDVPVRVEDAGTFSVLLPTGSYTLQYYNSTGGSLGTSSLSISQENVYNVSLVRSGTLAGSVDIIASGTVVQSVEVDNPLRCGKTGKLTFRNSFGGLEYMDIYGEVIKTVNTERNKFDYKEDIRGRANDNRENHYTYTINTGWIPEKYNDLIRSLFISPIVYINDDRIILSENTVEMKTDRRSGLFQYTFQGTNSVNFAEY